MSQRQLSEIYKDEFSYYNLRDIERQMKMKKNNNQNSDNTGLLVFIALILSGLTILGLPHLSGDLELYYYASQIVAAVFVIVAGLAAVWQYVSTSKNNQTRVADTRVQRAIDLSEYYKDHILIHYPGLLYVFDKCGAIQILNSIPFSKMVSFDNNELNNNLTPEQIKKLKDVPTSSQFIQAVVEADEIYHLGLPFKKDIITKQKDDGSKEVKITVNAEQTITAFLANVIDCMLNNMEYFAMAFTHNTADESVIYQSLHQSYFDIIRILYYFISKNNTNSTDKYYTNAIKLYHIWRRRSVTQEKRRKMLSNSNIHSGTVID